MQSASSPTTTASASAPPSLVPTQAMSSIHSSNNSGERTGSTEQPQQSNAKSRNNGRRRKQNKKKQGEDSSEAAASTSLENQKPPPSSSKNPPQKAPKKKKPKKKKKASVWWKRFLPTDAVDPITLDPLSSLAYPPFAMVASEPYEPVVWPPSQKENTLQKQRERQVLQEQWGSTVTATATATPSSSTPAAPRPVNLFDGRALAYYMVSQLQFIDPLNRRDVTRDEIVHLDRYLRTHHPANQAGSIIEAFDSTVLSTAGATAQTPAGRARLLQHEASVLLQALFRGTTVTPPTTSTNQQLAQQFQDSENNQGRRDNTGPGEAEDSGIYSMDPAFVVIDDDLNPGLRGATTNNNLRPSAPQFVPSFPPLRQPAAFPSLAPPEAASAPPPAEAARQLPLPKTKTLSKIKKLVQKTDPQEKQRQWQAREANLRKAALSNLRFGAAPPIVQPQPTAPSPPPASDGQLERNRNLAQALGVGRVEAGDTEQPLQPEERVVPTEYPDTLIQLAKNDEIRLEFLFKLEKKWKNMTSSSLSLPPMDPVHRKLVHEYAEYWGLRTESFDPEPKRYVHCVGPPHPPTILLSTVVQVPARTTVMRTSLSLTGPPPLSTPLNTRGSVLLERERPKLELAQRTLPLPLPAVVVEEDTAAAAAAYREKMKRQQERKRQAQERAQQAVLAAFDSDDDDAASSSAWEEQEQAYVESDHEQTHL